MPPAHLISLTFQIISDPFSAEFPRQRFVVGVLRGGPLRWGRRRHAAVALHVGFRGGAAPVPRALPAWPRGEGLLKGEKKVQHVEKP